MKHYECENQLDIFTCFNGISVSKVVYTAADFLTEVVLRGSGFENGKLRIEQFFRDHKSNKDRVAFVKNEYGIGGCGGFNRKEYGLRRYDTCQGKGITVTWSDEEAHEKSELIPWSNVVQEIARLISINAYCSPAINNR